MLAERYNMELMLASKSWMQLPLWNASRYCNIVVGTPFGMSLLPLTEWSYLVLVGDEGSSLWVLGAPLLAVAVAAGVAVAAPPMRRCRKGQGAAGQHTHRQREDSTHAEAIDVNARATTSWRAMSVHE